MTTIIARWCLLLLFCSVVSGCGIMPALHFPTAKETEHVAVKEAELLAEKEAVLLATEEAKLFAKGLDQFLATGELTTLSLLPKTYPQGVWRPRAEGIIKMAKQQQRQDAQLQTKTQQLNRFKTEKNFLVNDNKMLEVTLERLKQVLIDMELRED